MFFSDFRVIDGIGVVINVISTCRRCKEKHARLLHQVMCLFPEERGTP